MRLMGSLLNEVVIQRSDHLAADELVQRQLSSQECMQSLTALRVQAYVTKKIEQNQRQDKGLKA